VTEDDVLLAFAAKVKTAGLLGPIGTLGIGDDAAVVRVSGELVTSVDVVVEGIHGDFSLTSLQDFGWRAVGAALSDLAAMGVMPIGLLSSVVTPDLESFHDLGAGILAAAKETACPILGGDVSRGPVWSVSITVFGETHGEPVILRSGAQVGDLLVVTGSLGGAALGLELLRAPAGAHTRTVDDEAAILRHCRPQPRLNEGVAARQAQVHAMCDLSDGLGIDLDRLAKASGVGVVLDQVPVFLGATEPQALGGGDDYELLIATGDLERLSNEFFRAGLAEPIVIGRCVENPQTREFRGQHLDASGWRH
jgi:thiamine-monophosphate kinase